MIEMKETKVHEEQVMSLTGRAAEEKHLPLTVKNAHRAAMIRRKGADGHSVSFHYRKKHLGMHSYVHLYGNPEDNQELRTAEFKEWEVTCFKHPGYLEEYWQQACDAYHWSSFDPEVRGATHIQIYEEQLHKDLEIVPQEKQEEYIRIYKQKFSSLIYSLSRCANPMLTGRSNFDFYKNEKRNKAYRSKYEDFQEWRGRFLNAMKRLKKEARPEEEKQEETWFRLKQDILSSANTIHEIDTGKAKGYHRALFVSSILNKVSTFANKGEVEIVKKAVDFITEFNAGVKKPVITPRNRFFQLPEIAERMQQKLKVIQGQESKEVAFEGGTLVWNYKEDRLQILFNNIPEDNKRKELKSYGFRWSPKNKAWQRQLTQNAVHAAKRVLNLQTI